MIGTTLILGALTAVGVIITIHKLGSKKVAGNDIIADITITAGLAWLFAGTITGLMTAATAGILVSLYIIYLKRTGKVEKLTWYKGRLAWRPVLALPVQADAR